MDYNLLVETACLAGEIMLKSGAETYRVEDTMHHILKTAGAERTEELVVMTGILASISGKEMGTVTVLRRVSKRGTNLNNIVVVNGISRKFCGGEISLEEANAQLREVKMSLYSHWIYSLGVVGVVTGFSVFFGGDVQEAVGALSISAILAAMLEAGKRMEVSAFFLDMVSSFGIAVLTVLFKLFLFGSMNTDIVIISAIMPLVPGVAITNAVRDTLQGDYISGGARMLEAFLQATAIAIGVGMGIALFKIMMAGGM